MQIKAILQEKLNPKNANSQTNKQTSNKRKPIIFWGRHKWVNKTMNASGLQHPCTGMITTPWEWGLGFLLESLLPHRDAPLSCGLFISDKNDLIVTYSFVWWTWHHFIFFWLKPYVRQTPRRMGISFFIFLVASTLEEINFSPSPWLAMQSYKISLHRLKTSVDGWSIVRNHREFLSCCIAVTSFSFTRMKIDNSKRKGVLEISSSLFPIRKRLRLIPPLQPIFISSTNCSNPRSGSDSRKLPCSAKHFSICPTPAEVNEVDANAPSGSQASQLPRTGVCQPVGHGGRRASPGPQRAASVLPRTTSVATRPDSSACRLLVLWSKLSLSIGRPAAFGTSLPKRAVWSAPTWLRCNEPPSDKFNVYPTSWLILLILARDYSSILAKYYSLSVLVEGSGPHLLSFLVYCLLCFSFHRLITNISLSGVNSHCMVVVWSQRHEL